MKQNRMTRQPPEEIQPFLDNPFLKDFRGRDIIYTKDFYVAMYKKISEEHMTYVAAYNSLGFSTAVLGEDRANSAGKRAMQLGREGRLFTADPSSYDGLCTQRGYGGHVPSGRTGLSESQKCLFGGAGCSSKKTPFRIGGHNYIIESEGVSADRFYMVDSFIRRQADRSGRSVYRAMPSHIWSVQIRLLFVGQA